MCDDSFCCLGSVIFGAKKIRIDIPKVQWIPESLSGSVILLWSYTCTLMCMLCMFVVLHYAPVDENLYNSLFIGQYKSVAYQAVSITLSKGCSSGFVHSSWLLSTAKNIHPGYQNTDPKVELQRLVAYHYNPVGGHMGKFKHIHNNPSGNCKAPGLPTG